MLDDFIFTRELLVNGSSDTVFFVRETRTEKSWAVRMSGVTVELRIWAQS